MFYVYILKSLKNGRLYTGHTNNIQRRFEEHNSGMSKYTKGNGPYELVYTEKYMARCDAVKRERYLKTGKGREEIIRKMKI